MSTTQHDHDESVDTGSSRPPDPAVLAAGAGKASPERSPENPRQRPPSQRHNRGPPSDDEPVERLAAGDLLVGADAIRAFLIELGMPKKTADPYYLKRTGRWPIGNTGGKRRKTHRQQAPAHPSRRRTRARLHRRLSPDPQARSGDGGPLHVGLKAESQAPAPPWFEEGGAGPKHRRAKSCRRRRLLSGPRSPCQRTRRHVQTGWRDAP